MSMVIKLDRVVICNEELPHITSYNLQLHELAGSRDKLDMLYMLYLHLH